MFPANGCLSDGQRDVDQIAIGETAVIPSIVNKDKLTVKFGTLFIVNMPHSYISIFQSGATVNMQGFQTMMC